MRTFARSARGNQLFGNQKDTYFLLILDNFKMSAILAGKG
jgi:hypothetical protein